MADRLDIRERWRIEVCAYCGVQLEYADPAETCDECGNTFTTRMIWVVPEPSLTRGAVDISESLRCAYRWLSNVDWNAHSQAENRRWVREATDVLREATATTQGAVNPMPTSPPPGFVIYENDRGER